MLAIQAIILGIIQGLTEFIPISSSAHLIIVPWLFGWTDPALTSLTFDVSLHIGTLIAVLAYFSGDWVRLIRAGIASIVERRIGGDQDRRLAWFLAIGCIPGGLVGVIAESKIERLFHEPNAQIQAVALVIMGIIIAVMALALFTVERLARHTRAISSLSLKDTLFIGCAQALAIFPGVSRSGSTITAGLALGLQRETAARFSFLLGTPIIAGAGMKSLTEVIHQIHAGTLSHAELQLFPIGCLAAAISGYLCIKYLLRFLKEHTTDVFVYYRLILATVVIAVALYRG